MEKLTDLWNSFKGSSWLYLGILLVVIIIAIILYRSKLKKNLAKRISDGQIKINEMKSHPFNVDIAKTDAIAKVNQDLAETAKNAKIDYETFQSNLKNIVSNLQDAKEYLDVSKFSSCKNVLDENEELITETLALTSKLQDVLHGVLNQSTIHRKRINELKNEFHEIKTIINENPNNYTFCWEALDKKTNDISHKFSDFEAIMDASKYEQAASLANVISKAIVSLNDLVQRLPELINCAIVEIPDSVAKLNNSFTVLTQEGAYLDHLNFNGFVDNINILLTDILTSIKKCEIDGINDKIIDCQSKINQIGASIEEEKTAFKDVIKTNESCNSILDSTFELLERIKNTNGTDFTRYGLKEMNQQFSDISKEYADNKKAYLSLNEAFLSKSIPSTALIITLKTIEKDATEALGNLKGISEALSNSKISEVRVRNLINRFIVVLNESKASIKLSKLPNISKQYDEDIAKIEFNLNDMEEKLSQNTLNIDSLLKQIEDTQKSIVSLYNNVNMIVETANDIEEFIISANKYRPYFPDVDNALYSAELAYRNGEYTKASKLAINAIENIDPQAANALNEKLNKKLSFQKAA